MRQLDERQRQLALRGVLGAFIALIVIFLFIISAQILIGHALFADESLMLSLILALVLMPLIGYELAADAYLSQQRAHLLPGFAIVFSWLAVGQWALILQAIQRHVLDPIWAHGQVQFGALTWLMAIAWTGLAIIAWIKVVHSGHHLHLNRAQGITLGIWSLLLVITFWVRAKISVNHTDMLTTLGNFVIGGLPLLVLSSRKQAKRWYWIAAWAWLGLWVYLQWFH